MMQTEAVIHYLQGQGVVIDELFHCGSKQVKGKISKELDPALDKYIEVLRLCKEMLEESIDLIDRRQFHQFDPLVGENCCQIRVAMLLDLFTPSHRDHCSSLRAIIDRVERVRKRVEELRRLTSEQDKCTGADRSSDLAHFLQSLDLRVTLQREAELLLCSHVLTIHKQREGAGRRLFNREVLGKKTLGNLSKTETATVLKSMQKRLAYLSVAYQKEQSANLASSHAVHRLFHGQERRDCVVKTRQQQLVTPFFASVDLLCEGVFQRVPVVLRLHRIVKQTEAELGISLFASKKIEEGALAVVIDGCAIAEEEQLTEERLQERVVRLSLSEILLANAAAHRQYPEEKEDPYSEDNLQGRYRKYRHLALQEGLSRENPSLCQVIHLFCCSVDGREGEYTLVPFSRGDNLVGGLQ